MKHKKDLHPILIILNNLMYRGIKFIKVRCRLGSIGAMLLFNNLEGN